MIGFILLAMILVVLGGILAALKKGFNETIKCLESIDETLSKRSE